MKITVLSQPATDPKLRLGTQLAGLLSSQNRFTSFNAVVAFAKLSGVSRISEAIRRFKANGGNTTICVGFDHQGTSKQALEAMLGLFDKVFVFHDTNLTRTFHPKIYLLESINEAVVFVGSGNMTGGGLYSNYETQLRIDINRQDPNDEMLFQEFKSLFGFYTDTRNVQVKELTLSLISDIEPYLTDESIASSITTPKTSSPDSARSGNKSLSTIFGSPKYVDPPAPDKSLRISRKHTPKATNIPLAIPVTPVGQKGFWKLLSPWDVNPNSSPGQIQIPQEFDSFFPTLRVTKGPDAGGKGTLKEKNLSVKFVDGSYSKVINSARYVRYEPKTGHKRPNIEARFTFHDKKIFSRLSAADILVFREHAGGQYQFEVQRITPTDPNYTTYRSATKKRWKLL